MSSPRLPTGATLALTAALALGLSLAPLPDALRPLPQLARGPLAPGLLALLRPARRGADRPPPPAQPLDAEPSEEAEPALAEAALTGAAPAPPPLDARQLHALAGDAEQGLGEATRAKAAALEALRAQLGAAHVELEPGCRRAGATAGSCEEEALAPFFAALRALDTGGAQAPVRVVHLGDSLVASDHITDLLRARLQERHGSGGAGLLFIDRPQKSGRGVRAGTASAGFQVTRLTDLEVPPGQAGLLGVTFSTAAGASETARFDAAGARVAELFFLAQPGGGSVQVSVDGRVLQRVQTRFERAQPAFARLSLPAGARELLLRTQGKVELHGVSLERGGPGVVYDTVGLAGADARVFLRAQAPVFRAELRRRHPSLVVLMLGGNEAFRLSRGWTSEVEVRRDADALALRVREQVPEAACLVVGPLDAAVRTLGGELVARKGTAPVARILREVAQARGCAFWDAQAAMGGEGAAERWLAAGVLHEDLVHPRARGSDLMGHLLDFALARAFARSRPPDAAVAAAVPDPAGLHFPEALARTFAAWRAREAGAPERLAIAQLGASHTAAHYFSDHLREVLTARFGERGRGFIAAGKSSPRLERAKVTRALSEGWTVEDALATPAADPQTSRVWGLTGTRAVGAPEATLRIAFCEGCADEAGAPAVPATLQLSWVAAAGGSVPELLVDGERVPLSAGPAPAAPGLRITQLPVQGAAHTLELRNPGPAPLTVLGAALELERPGLVYDALGLPSATAATLASFEPGSLAQQLKARHPGLLVLWYGTNEASAPALDAERYRTEYGKLIAQLREATGAECLLIGPTDRLAEGGGEAPSLATVLQVLPEVARAQGCAYWSARAAMGGELSMVRWQRAEPALGLPDGVHLTPVGYERLADLFLADVLAAYAHAGTSPAQPRAVAEGQKP
ncbi:hypothetical protein FGE12_27345 [Aggregicoccus sp. 17bor-14]|uniref:GDSL-type esterase/lipase family protein n=1 Tax=Myxococcaceae TaxID=31 RepID=UPI00129CE63D|nr:MULTISPECIES: GDSL-type esterase/lipase family protein [Myxococcaceae]MBF5046162.1 hypothetical protein [Simulacricoccus sp. 17bor-14]MRI91887.1 hypothetical protein [Aggregicoccus sp. 17bor-14]